MAALSFPRTGPEPWRQPPRSPSGSGGFSWHAGTRLLHAIPGSLTGRSSTEPGPSLSGPSSPGFPPRLSAAASPRPLFSALQSRTVGLYLRFSGSARPGWDLPSRKSHKKPGKSPRRVPSSRFSAPPRAPSFCFLLLFSVSGRLRLAGACCLGGSRRGGRWSTGGGCDDARRPLAVWKRVHEIGLKPVT